MVKSWAQAGQDAWVHSIVGDSGYFVDVGAHDGIVHSNTYALERLGWGGICIEPNRDVYEELKANRLCDTANFVVSSVRGPVGFDGVRVDPTVINPHFAALLWEVIGDYKPPPVIDYLSIDVEGHELQVLAGMDFDRWHVRLITIEHNLYCDGPDRKNAIYDVLTGHGFERVREDVVAEGYGAYEDWYRSKFEQEMRAVKVLDAAHWPSPR